MKNGLSPSSLQWLKKSTGKSNIKQSKYVLIEGEKMVVEIINNPYIKIYQIFATSDFIQQSHQQHLAIPEHLLTLVSWRELERISHLKTPKNVIAVIEKEMIIPKRTSKLVIALDNIQDPGNLGTIIRTCDWFGVEKIVCSQDSVAHFNQKTIQAAMGSIFRVNVEYVNLESWLADQRKPIFLATIDGQDMSNFSLPNEASILVLGNESQGISESILSKYPQSAISVSRHPLSLAESLNVSVACGILVAKFLHQST